MEIKFDNMEIPCLMPVLRKKQNLEETQELRLGEDMPDIGRILGAWGQVILRGKDWNAGQLGVSGGVMVWILYMPEDNSGPLCVESWVPFQTKWEGNDSEEDGKLRVICSLRSVDARSTSARKLMIRVGLCISCEAWSAEEICVPIPIQAPENVYLLRNQYPVMLPVESGEKMFALNEELTFPDNCPRIHKLMRFELHPEMADQKVVADKAVFRGMAILKILYLAEDGQLYSREFEIPFSQFTELNKAYSESAQANFWLALTNLELEQTADGGVRLQGGITGQYLIYDREILDLVEDAYCIHKKEELKIKTIQLPTVLDCTQKTVFFDGEKNLVCQRVADVFWNVAEQDLTRGNDEAEALLRGTVQMLYYDIDGMLQSCSLNMETRCGFGADQKVDIATVITQGGKLIVSNVENGLQVHGEAKLGAQFTTYFLYNAVESVLLDDRSSVKSEGPSLILLRPSGESLWNIAKKSGSSVEAIMKANGISDEPEKDNMLLIPVYK